jgi:hypothetical protein
MKKLKESAKRQYARIPQRYKDDIKEVFQESYRFARTAAIAKVIVRLTELKK